MLLVSYSACFFQGRGLGAVWLPSRGFGELIMPLVSPQGH